MADPGFQYGTWAARFPALAAQVPSATASLLYAEALLIPEGSLLVNSCSLSSAQVITLMNLLVAHLAFLSLRDAGAVGHVSDASEGSVSASFEYPSAGTTVAWYGQSQYGAQFWRMMAPYRTGGYVPGPAVVNAPGLPVSLLPNVW